jgi:hypothetical protein
MRATLQPRAALCQSADYIFLGNFGKPLCAAKCAIKPKLGNCRRQPRPRSDFISRIIGKIPEL